MEGGFGNGVRRTPDRLTVHTVPVEDPGDLLARLSGPAALTWIHHGDGLAGWGEAARITLPAGEDRFTAAEKWLRSLFDGARIHDRVGLPGCGPVAFGSFTFDPTSEGSVLVVPAAVLGRRAGRSWLTTIAAHGGPAPAPPWPQPQPGPAGGTGRRPGPAEVRWHDGSLSAQEWQRAVEVAVGSIREGRLGKVVLARDLRATAAAAIDVRLVLERLAARYPDCYTFACAGLVGATPELLISQSGREIRARVLAGTIPRAADPERDAALGAELLSSAKDAEEHAYAVAGVRRALAPLCEDLVVAARPSLLRLANVQHLTTAVTGRLPVPGAGGTHHGNRHAAGSVLSLVAALHPTPAVCGTPTDTAMDTIRDLEGMDRGRYAGPVGWVDHRGNGEWGIALRCAEIDGSHARLFAGCGIVAGSDPEAELAEAQSKFRPMQFAIEG